MNTFDPTKRKVMTFDQFDKQADKVKNRTRKETGESEIQHAGMSGETKGEKGYNNTMDGKPTTEKGEHSLVKKSTSNLGANPAKQALTKPVVEGEEKMCTGCGEAPATTEDGKCVGCAAKA